ncbi:hypothetical protein D1872_279610 [compost metagenome]
MPDMVQSLKGHASGQRPVADDGDDFMFLSLKIAGQSHPHRRGQRGAAVSRLPDVMLAFAAFDEAAQPVFHPKRIESIHTSGQYFMNIGLMPYVENKFIPRAVVTVVQGDCQLDHPQIGSQMAARNGQLFN